MFPGTLPIVASSATASGSPDAVEVRPAEAKPQSGAATVVTVGNNDRVRDIRPYPTLGWAIMQLIPSPGLAIGDTGAHGAMSWQLTPFLYSWAMDKRLVPLRFLVVEPIVRQSGSFELFVSPIWIGRGEFERSWGARFGGRAYFPITERGDGLSWSLGASAFAWNGDVTPTFDAGIYTLFGGFGLLVSVSPWAEDARTDLALRIRYF